MTREDVIYGSWLDRTSTAYDVSARADQKGAEEAARVFGSKEAFKEVRASCTRLDVVRKPCELAEGVWIVEGEMLLNKVPDQRHDRSNVGKKKKWSTE